MTLNLRPVPSHVTNWAMVELAAENLEKVREYFRTHLCATQRECADALGLSIMAVNRHVKTIRSTWRKP